MTHLYKDTERDYNEDENDEDYDDDEEDVRMMGMISKTHPTTIPWSDLLSQLGQLCVHEGDIVLT